MRAELMSGLLWGMLLLGAGMVGFSLLRDTTRFRQWKRVQATSEGEPVLAQDWLKPGLPATVLFPSEPEAREATLSEVHKKHVALTPEPGITPPRIGDPIQVTLTQETGLYRFSAIIHKVRANKERPGIYQVETASPFWLTRLQRRQHVRTAVHISADFALTESPQDAEPSFSVPGTVINLSGGGFRAELRGAYSAQQADELLEMLTSGKRLQLRLPVPGLSDTLLRAQVRESQRIVTQGGLSLRFCCEFLPLPIWEQDLIVSYVFRAQREYGPARSSTKPKLRLVQG